MRVVDDRVRTAGIQDGAVVNAKITNGTITEPKLVVPTGNTKNALRVAKFIYDFAVDGGAIAAIPFRGEALPANSIIKGGRAYVVHELTSGGAASAGITAVAGDDLIADTLIAAPPWNLANTEIGLIPIGTLITDVPWPAGGIPTLNVEHFVLTDGLVYLWLEYIVIG
ncbi:MAG: hypothetical protein V1767_00940 [Chloroflexota bacterium]